MESAIGTSLLRKELGSRILPNSSALRLPATNYGATGTVRLGKEQGTAHARPDARQHSIT